MNITRLLNRTHKCW